MTRMFYGSVLITLILVCGCVGGPETRDVFKPITGGKFSKRKSESASEQIGWNWTPAAPSGVARAEVVGPTIERQSLARFVPEYAPSDIRLVSTSPSGTSTSSTSLQIAEINGNPVKDFAQLHAALENVLATGKAAKTRFDSGSELGSEVELTPEQLVSLSQFIAPGESCMRVVEGGKSIFVSRESNLRCKLMARLENNHGLVQVVLSLANCWGESELLPNEVTASFNGQPLKCLTAAQTLELLYGDNEVTSWTATGDQQSFAAISEKEDYLLPTNFKRLEQKQAETNQTELMSSRQPALLSVAGQSYPGPALVGDARALTKFLLQRQLYAPGDQEQTGWIMFAAKDLNAGGVLEVDVDFGDGPQPFRFMVANQ